MVEITIACGDYDRTATLVRGTQTIDGVLYNYLPLTPAEIFWRMYKYEEFDVCEMSLGTYTVSLGLGDKRFCAIPVFPSRVFRHGNLYVRTDSSMQNPTELKGCKIGVPEYEITAAIWIRGFLSDSYGVKTQDVEWVVGREEKITAVPFDKSIKVTYKGKRNLEDLLLTGEIDAIATAVIPNELGRGIRRLIPNYFEVEKEYYKQTNVFPIMHTLVIKRVLCEKYPWLIRSLYKAFVHAKEVSDTNMYRTNALAYSIPWLIPYLENNREIMGKDVWTYGIENNIETLSTFVRYLEEQSLTKGLLKIEDLFEPAQWTNQP